MVISNESVQVLPEQILVTLQTPTMEELSPPALARADSMLKRPETLSATATRIRKRFFGINRTPTARDDNRRTKTSSRVSPRDGAYCGWICRDIVDTTRQR